MTQTPEVEELSLESMGAISGGVYYFALPVFLHIGLLLDLIS